MLESLGPIDGVSAVEMINLSELAGDVGDSVYDFFLDEIENEAETIWSGTVCDPDDQENPDTNFPIGVSEYCGVFFVWALEYDNAGYFLSQKDAMQYLMGTHNYVTGCDSQLYQFG